MLYDVEMQSKAIRENWCTAGGTRIHYLERDGEYNTDALVLLHSFASGAFLWRNLIDSVPFSGRIIAPDLPGNGGSSLPLQEPTIDYYVQFLKDFCNETALLQFVGIGVSMGSNVLAKFALKDPEKIKRLILINPIDDFAPMNPLWKIAAQPFIAEMIMNLFPRSLNALRKQIAKNFYDPTRLNPALISTWWDVFETGEVRRWIPKALRARPTTIQWENIRVPCTVVFGKNDPQGSENFRTRLRNTLTNAEYIELDQCGHYPHLEHPETIQALIAGSLTD